MGRVGLGVLYVRAALDSDQEDVQVGLLDLLAVRAILGCDPQ